MVTAFNDSKDIEDRLKFLGPNTDKWDLGNRLERAHEDMQLLVGTNKVSEELRLDRKNQTTFDLAFPNVFKVLRIDWKDEPVPEDKYEVVENDYAPDQIKFDEKWAEQNYIHSEFRPVIDYIPNVLKNLELQLAVEEITMDSSTQTSDSERKAQAEQYSSKVQRMVKSFNRKTVNLSSNNRGSTVTSNYNWPGQR